MSRTRFTFLSGLVMGLFLMAFMPAYAAEEAQEEAAEPAAAEATSSDDEARAEEQKALAAEQEQLQKQMQQRQKMTEKIQDLLVKITADKNEEDKKHLFVAYSNYNLLSTAKIVRDDVETAVKNCGEKNPDMKATVDDRFKIWREAVDPALEEAQANLDNMIAVQTYAPKKDIRELFAAVDSARDHTNEQIDKIPVSTPEACDYLVNKMDETQEKTVNLIRATLTMYSSLKDEEAPEIQPVSESPEAAEKAEEAPAEKTEDVPAEDKDAAPQDDAAE